MASPFKIAFPCITLPDSRGGRRAALIFAVADRLQPNFILGTCIDDRGIPHMNVPLTRQEITSAKPMVLVEDPNGVAPSVGGGSGLVGPNGQRL